VGYDIAVAVADIVAVADTAAAAVADDDGGGVSSSSNVRDSTRTRTSTLEDVDV